MDCASRQGEGAFEDAFAGKSDRRTAGSYFNSTTGTPFFTI